MSGIIAKVLPFINKALPAAFAIKGLEKIDPKIGAFMSGAFGAGYTSNEVLDFLRDKFQPAGNTGVRERLEEKQAQGTARPDESAALTDIRNVQRPADLAANAITGASAISGGLGAVKSLSNIDKNQQPSESVQSTESPGIAAAPPPVPQGEGVTRSPKSTKPQAAPLPTLSEGESPLDFLAKYSSKLARSLGMKIQGGSLPRDAAIVLKSNPGALKTHIDKIERDTHENFEDLVEELFGAPRGIGNVIQQGQQKMQQNQQRVQGMQNAPIKQQLMQTVQQANQILNNLMKGRNG